MSRDLWDNVYRQLEFDRILEDLVNRCAGEPGRELCRHLQPKIDTAEIQHELDQVSDFVETLSLSERIRVMEYRSVTEAYRWLEVENSALKIEDILEIRNHLNQVNQWFEFFTKDRRNEYPHLHHIIARTEPLPELITEVDKILDHDGTVKDSASSALKEIRSRIRSKLSVLDKTFNKAMQKYHQSGFLTETQESVKNGRRVLAVTAEFKRRVNGIIMDESSSGRTVFIEPKEAVQLDNEIFELRNEERREVNRILRELTGELSSHRQIVMDHFEVIVRMDTVQARCTQTVALGAGKPKLSEYPHLSLKNARHPLLLLKHQGEPEKVIPFDLDLDQEQSILIISGPNAGGKTITLKAVGLLTLMTQCGLMTPLDPDSMVGIFHHFFADIGDQQSIENDLSTYSSHLKNMSILSEKAGKRTLFLIDEFGSGTEPLMGGAIAESILKHLHNKGAKGVVTTHYGNLKLLASNTKGLRNASMAFDKEALKPTYALRMGVPGSSFAFDMARRSGLSPKIIHHAKKKIGKKEGKLETLITTLQKEKNQIDKKLAEISTREEQLEKLIQNYDRMRLDLEVNRKKLRLDEKTMRLQEETRANKKLEKVIREIREKEKLDEAKKLANKIKESKKELAEDVTALREDILQKASTHQVQKPFKVGDFVRMKSGGATGQIQRINKDKIMIVVGNMKIDTRLRDVEHSRQPIDVYSQKSIQTEMVADQETYNKLDIRGLRREEALQRIEKFVDKALVANLYHLEIVHGKGNGTLRKLVQQKLREYDIPIEANHPSAEKGGEGVTVINLNP